MNYMIKSDQYKQFFMKTEIACGFVIFVETENGWSVVLLDNGDFISHPKGHVEDGETKLETAIRELKEETNLIPKAHSSRVVHTKKYIIKKLSRDIKKIVHLFAGVATNANVKISKEHRRFILLDAFSKQAMDTLTYQDDRDSLKEALNWLQNDYISTENV